MFEINRIIDTDSYKASHFLQYPPNTTLVHSYLESRGSERNYSETVFFGLQYLLKRYFVKPFTKADVLEANEVITAHGEPFNLQGWLRLIEKHNGKLPLRVRAVAEGSIVPTRNVLMTVENTDDEFFWLTGWFESQFMRIWYPITVATQSYYIKRDVYKFLQETADDADAEIGFKVHDFGSRGVSSQETAAIGGAAHLVNFFGSDTMASLLIHRNFYNCEMAGFSIPAAEHSTITSWGRENEIDAYRNILKHFAKPNALVAVVSDSWNIYEAVEKIWGEQLKQEVIDSGATIVIRPDCYDEKTEILTDEGWKLFSNIGKTKVAQVDKNFNLSFTKPIKYVEQDYSGKMYHFRDNKGRLDLLVTPNHRIILTDRKQNIFVSEAKEAKFRDNRSIPRTVYFTDNTSNLSSYERFLIAFQADGSFPSGFSKIKSAGSLCGHIKVRFNFTKQRKIKRLVEICKETGLEYTLHKESKRQSQTIYVNVPLERKLTKYFKDWVIPSSRNSLWCQEFIEELSNWDATIRKNEKTNSTRIKYDTTIEDNADIIQQIAMFGGFGCTYSITKDNRKDVFSDIHCLHITDKKVVNGQAITTITEEYTGKIYCVQVPTGMIIVRRNKKAVISGNSGDPVEVVGKVAEILERKFGIEINSKSYKVLKNVRIIQGDGVNPFSIHEICQSLKDKGFSTSNIAFGIGGALLQKIDRDTMKFAYKCSAIVRDGKLVDVYKEPITDTGKSSKKGRLDLIKDENGEYKTVVLPDIATISAENSQLTTVFENGQVLVVFSADKTGLKKIKTMIKISCFYPVFIRVHLW